MWVQSFFPRFVFFFFTFVPSVLQTSLHRGQKTRRITSTHPYTQIHVHVFMTPDLKDSKIHISAPQVSQYLGETWKFPSDHNTHTHKSVLTQSTLTTHTSTIIMKRLNE